MPENSSLRPKGFVQWTDLDGGLHEGETLQCCHCAGHWRLQRGSGKRRGFCTNCGQVTCGRPECDTCTPYERKLDNELAGLPEHHRTAQILVPRDLNLNIDDEDSPKKLLLD